MYLFKVDFNVVYIWPPLLRRKIQRDVDGVAVKLQNKNPSQLCFRQIHHYVLSVNKCLISYQYSIYFCRY